MSELCVRAIDADNRLQVNDLIDLFYRVHENSYPIRKVYDVKFWNTHLGNRFSGIGVFADSELVAHIALRPEPDCQQIVRLDYPILAPRLGRIRELALEKLSDFIARQAERQSWKLGYYFMLEDRPNEHTILQRVLPAHTTAICPSYFAEANGLERSWEAPHEARPQKRIFMSISQHYYLDRVTQQRELFVPPRHLKLATRVFRPLMRYRQFLRPSHAALQGTAQSKACCTRRFQGNGVLEAFVRSVYAPDAEELLESMHSNPAASNFVFVNLEDPACPAYCERLEMRGFRFCGFLPELRGQDSIAYWIGNDFRLPESSMTCPIAKSLLSSMAQQTTPLAAIQRTTNRLRREGRLTARSLPRKRVWSEKLSANSQH